MFPFSLSLLAVLPVVMATTGTGWDAVALAVINLINLAVSAYNAKRLNTVRDAQKAVAASLNLSGKGGEK